MTPSANGGRDHKDERGADTKAEMGWGELSHDRAQADAFLRALDPNATSFTFQTFTDSKRAKVGNKIDLCARVVNGSLDHHWQELVALNRDGAGVYVTVNATDGNGRKLRNIMAVRGVWREADKQGLPPLPLDPTMTVESSPGKCHEYVLTDVPIADAPEFADVMAEMVATYGSDPNATDRSRVLRLPGFYHLKDDKPPTMVQLLCHDGPRHTWGTITAAFLPPHCAANATETNGIPGKPASGAAAIEGNLDRDEPEHKASRATVLAALACVHAEDRSTWLRMACALRRTYWPDAYDLFLEWSQTTRADKYHEDDAARVWTSINDDREDVITPKTIIYEARKNGFDNFAVNPTHPAAAYWRARHDGKTQPEAQAAAHAMNNAVSKAEGGPLTHGSLEKACARIEDWLAERAAQVPDWIQEMNARYFQAPRGSDVFVWQWVRNELGHDALQPMRQEAFVKLHAGDYLDSVGKRGTKVSKVQAWLADPRRRKYNAIQFLPHGVTPDDVYNLWRGFGVQPRQGDWALMLDHIQNNLCGGNKKYATYLVRWLMWCVQHPNKLPEVAIVLRGKRGTGKSIFARWLLTIFGAHGINVASPDQFTGRFNGHLRDKCFLFVDEGFWAGNKEAEGLLKQYITEPTITVERKNVDAERASNYLRIVIASNERWVVPSSIDERRFFALAVSDARAQDLEYFSTVERQAYEEGGIEAMLFDLQRINLKGWHPRGAPQTSELALQKEESLSPVLSWYLEGLRNGKLHEFDNGWDREQPRTRVVESITRRAHAANARAYASQSTQRIGGELAEVCPSLGRGSNIKCSAGGRQVNAWRFPDLRTACLEFENATGIAV